MSHMIIDELDKQVTMQDHPEFCVGDTISVHIRLTEGAKQRVQVFTGTVIALKGAGIHKTFSLHRNAYGEGMERVFQLHSPTLAKITVDRKGKVRRSKLYYLRGTSGKKARVKELIGKRKVKAPARKVAKPEAAKPEAAKTEEPANEE